MLYRNAKSGAFNNYEPNWSTKSTDVVSVATLASPYAVEGEATCARAKLEFKWNFACGGIRPRGHSGLVPQQWHCQHLEFGAPGHRCERAASHTRDGFVCHLRRVSPNAGVCACSGALQRRGGSVLRRDKCAPDRDVDGRVTTFAQGADLFIAVDAKPTGNAGIAPICSLFLRARRMYLLLDSNKQADAATCCVFGGEQKWRYCRCAVRQICTLCRGRMGRVFPQATVCSSLVSRTETSAVLVQAL
ncbi:hypothetical protein TRSC58_06517 [Trypanosoma rangeli SC58]|uniref:Uncharacterized protein n=1 Tax=Trypanosoma rangeli SC58 TaxID=429131 RepID=A0A061IUQ5_TRYRA|nr:hypothetical protein TRSC58_06517 [Trypanosoma rangeli SC58]